MQQQETMAMGLHVDYFASLNSPWTHLGAARLEAMVERHGATLRIYPVDFGTIFPASGGLPLPKRSPQRQAYRMQELERWREHLGIPIHLRPSAFPTDESTAARCVIALRETLGDRPALALAHRVLRALWEEDRNTGDRAVLEALIGELGLDAAAVLASASDERWAERRAQDTQDALARGVFGAPSYVVGDEIFWGQDRLEFLERRLARA
ncbi:2-hydroxychromene-2-carboxylate isomerase [Roseomonas sp. SSH11]|uniref:2-hydroxychromene-2-carboxylate isomerase n=1 Tax=Pararoseomonas baculiformis TaxID=2820812 RepID=A0ABS4AEG5_9PROT|nr:2-hydroxychromene-2-carboxylate isomerase [Pararoseomonas baculiformis]MBP0445410.1 2-hydroxychromene-2-carboxylate isomerase [Pararoseomonas baculiformis]